MTEPTLNQLVTEAFNNAKENGYTFESAEELAIDMCTCDADLEKYDVEDVEEAIKQLGLLK